MSSSTGCFLLQQRPRCSCCYFCTATAPLRLWEVAALTTGWAAPCAGTVPTDVPAAGGSLLGPCSHLTPLTQPSSLHPRDCSAPRSAWIIRDPRGRVGSSQLQGPSAPHGPLLLSARGPCTAPGLSPVRLPARHQAPYREAQGVPVRPPRSTGQGLGKRPLQKGEEAQSREGRSGVKRSSSGCCREAEWGQGRD